MRLIDANRIHYTMGHLKSLGGLSDFSSKSYASEADIYSVPVFDLEKHDEKVIDEFAKLLIDNLRDYGEDQYVIMAIDKGSILRLAKKMKEQRDGEN